MKKVYFLISFIVLFALNSFADTKKEKTAVLEKKVYLEQIEFMKNSSCTATIKWSDGEGHEGYAKVTYTCTDCSVKDACNTAFTIALEISQALREL